LAKNLRRKKSKPSITLEKIFQLQLFKNLHFIVTGSCNSSRHKRFMRENVFNNEISENISQKFHDQ